MDYNVTFRKKNKGFQFIISYKDLNGKWKQKSKQGFKTQKEAKPIIAKIIKELEKASKNKLVEDFDKYTFKDVVKIYLDHNSLYKEHNTIKGYKNCFNNFSDLNEEKIKDIERPDIQAIFDILIKRKLKPETIKVYFRRINTLFKYAKNDLNLIIKLPTEGIQIPKRKADSNKKALTKNELAELMNDLKDNRFYMVAYIAANTGMRLGEILGLTWNNVNFKTATITVDKQWKVLKNSKLGFGPLKSKNSLRNIPMSQNFISELKKYKRTAVTDTNNRVVPFNHNAISKHLNPELRRFAGISMHELRHTYATMLISNGVDFKTAAEILGHDVKQTMATYSHVNDDMMKKAQNIIENIF